MGCEHTVAVHHEFPSGEAGVGLRASKHKTVRRGSAGSWCPRRGKRLQRRGQHLVGEFPKQFIGGLLRLCWAERTTVSSRRGRPSSSYSTVTWAFPSGRRPRTMPDFRAVVRQAGQLVGQYNGKRQHLRGFRTGVPNHDPPGHRRPIGGQDL